MIQLNTTPIQDLEHVMRNGILVIWRDAKQVKKQLSPADEHIIKHVDGIMARCREMERGMREYHETRRKKDWLKPGFFYLNFRSCHNSLTLR